MSLLFRTTESRVTRNSESEKLLREACKNALERGGFFEIREEYSDCWWTLFTIIVPVDEGQ